MRTLPDNIANSFSNFIFFAFLLAASSGLAYSSNKTVGQLKVGLVLPLSGKMAIYGQEVKDGFAAGLTDYITESKKNDKEIKVIYKDNRSSASHAKKVAEELIKKQRVSVLIGGFSSLESTALADLAQAYNKIFISLMSKDIDNISKKINTFMLSSSYRWQAEIAAEYVAKFEKSQIITVIMPENADRKVNLIASAFSKSIIKKSTKRLIRAELEKKPELPEPMGLESQSDFATDLAVDESGETTAEKQNKLDVKPIDPKQRYEKLANQIKKSKSQIIFFPLSWSASAPIIDALVRTEFSGKIIGLEYWESRPAYKKLLTLGKIIAYHVTHYRPDVLPSKFVIPFIKTNIFN